MSKQQRGLGKGLGALLGGDADLSNIRKPVGYVNKEVVTAEPPKQGTADILRIPVDMQKKRVMMSSVFSFLLPSAAHASVHTLRRIFLNTIIFISSIPLQQPAVSVLSQNMPLHLFQKAYLQKSS